jgi:uncharacterized protein (DUF488 family)
MEQAKRPIAVFTIGFTKKSAEDFFQKLCASGVKRVIDVRLHNVSQLAGFAKKDDLRYFLQRLCGIEYIHAPLLAPTQELLDVYRKQKGAWETYEKEFLQLMESRRVEDQVARELVDQACLLCSEAEPEHCHRRLVAEYLRDKWQDAAVEITHII